jgi:hypothetical protein
LCVLFRLRAFPSELREKQSRKITPGFAGYFLFPGN